MSSPELRFVVTRHVGVHADFHRKRAVISCETEDGKSIRLDVDFKTLEKLHKEIQKELETT
jgi:hypothetical protein